MIKIKISKQDIFMVFGAFLLITAVAFIATPQNIVFHGINPHPYLILSIVLAINYGYRFSIISSLFLSAFYLGVLHFQVDYQKVETLLAVEFLTLPLTMIFFNPLIGEMCERLRRKSETLEDGITSKKSLIEKQTNQLNTFILENEELKRRLVSKLDTVNSLYINSIGLNKLSKNEIFKSLADILINELEVNDLTIYKLKEDKIISILTYKNDSYEETGRYESEVVSDEVIKKCIELKRPFYINSSFFELKENSAIYAAPMIIDEEIKYVVAFNKMPFLKFIPSNLKIINLYIEWSSHSIQRSDYFEELLTDTIIDKKFHVYRYDFFRKRINESFLKAKKYNLSLKLLKIKIQIEPTLGKVRKNLILKTASELILTNLSQYDYATYDHDQRVWYIYAPLADESELEELRQKINLLFIETLDGVNFKESQFLCSKFSSNMQSSAELL